MRRRGAPRASGRAGRADSTRSGGEDGPCRSPPLFGASDPDRRERRRLLELDLAAAAQLEQREERDRLLDPRQPGHLGVEVEAAASAQNGTKTREELHHGWKPKLHVRERNRRRLGREPAQRIRERGRILGREPALDLWSEGRRPQPEEPVGLRLEQLGEELCAALRPPVGREPPRQLARRLLWLELGELGVLVRKERTRLQLEQRRHQDEELAARFEVARVEPLAERQDDLGHVHVDELELLLQDERQEQVERAGEGVQVQLELAHDHATTLLPVADGDHHRARPRGIAIFGPAGKVRVARFGSSPPRWKNCHHTKNAVEQQKTTIETQAFSRSPAKWWAGSTRSSSSKNRPKV